MIVRSLFVFSLLTMLGACASDPVGSSPAPSSTGAATHDAGAADAHTPDEDAATDSAPASDAASATDSASADSAPHDCTPNPSAALTTTGDVVFDPRTCLSWMRATKEGVTMNPTQPPAANQYCNDLILCGYDDWRVPSIDELASILTNCGTYLGNTPSGPWNALFDVSGDGYWTTIAPSAGHICAIGSSNGGGYYKYGTDGPQRVRCVRGSGAVPHVKDCTQATGCKDW